MEKISFQIILHAGNSRSSSMEAMDYARHGDIVNAKLKLIDAKKELTLAHKVQTQLLVNQAQGTTVLPDILLVHAQDHLSAASISLDLSKELVHVYEILTKLMKEHQLEL